MFLKWKIFNHRMMFYSRRVWKTGGINSNLKDGLHIPLYDLDRVNIRELETEVINLQDNFKLGDAIIINTGREDSYHLYFLNRLTWRETILIGVSCRFVDLKHIQFSLKRGHFTLRVMAKAKRNLHIVSHVKSPYPSDVAIKDITSFVLYETANK